MFRDLPFFFEQGVQTGNNIEIDLWEEEWMSQVNVLRQPLH
jgi:hypothetical protein